jgi:hypothetical protein
MLNGLDIYELSLHVITCVNPLLRQHPISKKGAGRQQWTQGMRAKGQTTMLNIQMKKISTVKERR